MNAISKIFASDGPGTASVSSLTTWLETLPMAPARCSAG